MAPAKADRVDHIFAPARAVLRQSAIIAVAEDIGVKMKRVEGLGHCCRGLAHSRTPYGPFTAEARLEDRRPMAAALDPGKDPYRAD